MHRQSDSPAFPLANLLLADDPTPELVIITGPSGSGKTHTCLELVDILHVNDKTPTGLISSPVFENDQKIAIDLVAIHNEDQRRLATLREDSLRKLQEEDLETSVAYGRWSFNLDAFKWGNSLLRHLPSSDCLIIDELGPLEFQLGAGLQSGLSLLDRKERQPAFVVIREELVPAALKRWPWGLIVKIPHGTGHCRPPGVAK